MSFSVLVIVTAGISSVALPWRLVTIDEGDVVGMFHFTAAFCSQSSFYAAKIMSSQAGYRPVKSQLPDHKINRPVHRLYGSTHSTIGEM